MSGNIQRTVNMLQSPAQVQPRPMPAPPVSQAGLTPKEIAGIIRRHLWMIILLTILGTIIGGAVFVVQGRYFPKYTARGYIDILQPGESDPMQMTQPQQQKDIHYQFRVTKANLIKQQNMLLELIRQDRIQQTNWFKQFAKVDPEGNITGDRAKATLKAIGDLEDNFRASAPRDFTFIEISMTCGSAQESAVIVDEMIRLFNSNQRELAKSSISEQLAERRQQAAAVKSRLDQIEEIMRTTRAGTRFARLNVEGQNFRDYMDEKLADLENSFSGLEGERARLESVIATLKQRSQGDFDEVVREQMEQDTIARQIRTNISAIEPVLAQQLTRFGEDHRTVKDTRDAIKQMKEELTKRQSEIAEIVRQSNYRLAEDQMVSVRQQMETVTRQLQEGRAEYKEADRVRSEYAIFENKRQEEQKLLETMNAYIEKLNTLYGDPLLHKLRVLGNAAIPLRMSWPIGKILLLGGFMLGLLAGLGLAFAVELLNDLLRTPSEVIRHLRIPLLGNICHIEDETDIEGVELAHIVRQAPYSIMSECYRQLRTNLKMSGKSTEHQSLLVTSPSAGDGKTTVSVNLASTLLCENKRILLIDANFRRPSAGFLFPRTDQAGAVAEHSDFGLSNFLMGQCGDEKEIIRQSGIEGLDIIDTGPLPANPAELLESAKMAGLLERTKQTYDYVIIDGPPLLVSDAKSLASKTDGTLLVVNAANTHRGTAQRILRELQNIHANTVGTVLVGVKSRKGGYFREVYRSYQEYQRVQVNQQF